MNRALWLSLLICLGIVPVIARAAGKSETIPEGPTPKETELGKKYSAELEKDRQFKLAKDAERTRQLNELARSIAAVTGRPKFEYVVKLIEDRDPNAFTLPGGYVYFTTGLLDFCRSEHEIAAVMAHEIAHNARMHQMKMSNKENRLMWLDLLTMVGAFAAANSQSSEANRTGDYSKVVAPILFKDAVMKGLINRYSIEYEREADSYAFEYLQKVQRNPVGLLTFMERLVALEQRRPSFEPGVYMTHPTSKERVDFAYERLRHLGITINRSATTSGTPVVQVMETDTAGGAQVLVGGQVFFKLSGRTPAEALARAHEVAARYERAAARGLRSYELRKESDKDGVYLVAGKELIVAVREDDVSLNKATSADALVQKWIDTMRRWLLRGSIGA